MKNIGTFWLRVILVTTVVLFAVNLTNEANKLLGVNLPKIPSSPMVVIPLILLGIFASQFVGNLFRFFLVFAIFSPAYFIMLKSVALSAKLTLDPAVIWTIRGLSLSLAGLTYFYGAMILKSIAYKTLYVLFAPVRFLRKQYNVLKLKIKGVPPCPIRKTLKQIDALGNGDTYEKGRQFEEYIAQMYRVIGYNAKTTTQLRAEGALPASIQARGGSGEQGVDVIYPVYSPDGTCRKVIIQCKHYSQKVDNKAVQEIVAALSMYEAHHAVVITNNYFTKPARELAEANGVTLIDRDRLAEVIDKACNIYYQKNKEAAKKEKIDLKKMVA